MIQDYYSPKEAAKKLSVNIQTLRRYLREGKIKAVKVNNWRVRIPANELEKLISVYKPNENKQNAFNNYKGASPQEGENPSNIEVKIV